MPHTISVKRAGIVAVALFCVLMCSGWKARRALTLTVYAEGQVVLSAELAEGEDLPFFKRLFGFDYKKFALNMREEGLADKEILEVMFPQITGEIQRAVSGLESAALPARVKFNPNSKNKFEYMPESSGRAVDFDRLYADIICSISGRSAEASVAFLPRDPCVTQDELKKNTMLRGSFCTNYGYSGAARKSNIARAVSFINGTRLAPGAEFSFNGTVGARTVARGFKEAPIIVDGSYVSGVGGGVCQVSGTLYNAVLYADLAVKRVARHSLPVSYVPASFDAMVSSASDFVFVNSTLHEVFIEATADGNNIRIAIYGEPPEFEISLESRVIARIPPPTSYVDDGSLFEGEENVTFGGKEGLESRGYMIKRKNGQVVSRMLIRSDIYSPQARVVARGTLPKQAQEEGINEEAV